MKKLLILGANHIECDLVKRARELGYYTIVTDNHSNLIDSPAKKYADEQWFVSWSDIKTLEQKCRSKGVNGVLAGFSEFRVESMINLCNKLSLPCSLTQSQLSITRDKKQFKELCKRFNLPVVKEYDFQEQKRYPVIIKPVDRAGSIGINVAYNQTQFETFYRYAKALSPTGNVIIEDFISDGTKVDFYYFVQDGNPFFLGSSDTIMCKGREYAEILQKAWIFPSIYENIYLNEYETNFIKLLDYLKINNSYLTISTFFTNNKFYFFEAGFRLSGELSYNWYNAIAGINYLDCTIKNALNISPPLLSNKIEEKYSVILNIFVKDGEVKCIQDDILNIIPEVIAYNLYVQEGDSIHNNSNVLKKAAMITLISLQKDKVNEAVDMINKHYNILTFDNKSLIYEMCSSSEIINYK